MYPKSIGIVHEGDANAHGHHSGVGTDRKGDGRKNREDFHGDVEFIGEEGIVGGFEGLDDFFVVFEDIPDADIGADQILEIDFEFIWNERAFFLNDGFDNGTLWFDGATKVEDVSFDKRNFQHHFFFIVTKDLLFDIVQVFGNMIQSRKAGFKKYFKHSIEEVRRCFIKINSTLAFAHGEVIKKLFQLINFVAVRGDEMVFGDDHVNLAGIGGAFFGIKKGNVDGKKNTVLVTECFWLIGRRKKFFNGQRMDIEVLLQIENVVVVWFFKINPADGFVFDNFHATFVFYDDRRKKRNVSFLRFVFF